MTPGLQKYISIKNHLKSEFTKSKDPCKKGSPHKTQAIQKYFINTIKQK